MSSIKISHENDAAIIGMACIYPKAPDLETYWSNITQGVDAIEEVSEERIEKAFVDPNSRAYDRIPHRRAGTIEPYALFDPLEFGIQPATLEDGEPEQLLALKTAGLALKDAGLVKPFPQRTAVIVGKGGHLGLAESRHMGCITGVHQVVEIVHELMPGLSGNALNEIKEAFQKVTGVPRPENNIGFVPHLVAGRIANRLDFRGPSFVVDAACASSLIAVHNACRELALGDCDLAIAGGVHCAVDTTFFGVFVHLEALSRGVIRPLDRRADGMLMGEGVGMVVLKRASEAIRDGNRIYAVIRGSGLSSDGRSSSLMKPSVEGQVEAIKKAWSMSDLDPARIGLLEAHSPGTKAGDEAELTSLGRFFGPPAGQQAGIGSVKSMIGHLMGGAGMASFIKTVLAVHHGVLPPTLHCEEPNELLKKTRFRVINKAEPWECQREDRIAAVEAFGFGGGNAHVVLQGFADGPQSRTASVPGMTFADKGTAGAAPAPAPVGQLWNEKLLLIAADSPGELLKILVNGTSSPATKGSCRLGLLNPTPERIKKAAKIVERGRPWRGRMDMWFSPRGILEKDPKILFLFPGVEAEFNPQVDDILKLSGPKLPEGFLEQTTSMTALGKTDLVMRGVGVVMLGRLLNAALQEIGIRPNAIIGHSIGEWTGMIAAGIIADSDVDNLLRTATPDALKVPDMVFGVIGCGAEKAEKAITGLADVAVSHDNCPHQSILCGKSASIDAAIQRLSKQGVLCMKLPFQSGFHSPMFKDFLPDIKKVLDTFPLRPATIPMISATTLRMYPSEAKAMRELFLNHLVQPVRFRPLIEGMYRLGYRAFIQVGVGSLIEFTEDTLGHQPYVAIAANHPKRQGLEQLCHVAIALHVEGYPVNLQQLPLEIVQGKQPSPAPVRTGREKLLPLGYTTRQLPPEIISKYRVDPAVTHAPVTPEAAAAVRATGDPLLDTFNAATAEILEAQRVVLAAWEARRGQVKPARVGEPPRSGTVGETPKPAAAPQKQKTGVTSDAPKLPVPPAQHDTGEIIVNQTLSLEEYPELIDHSLFHQPPGWPEVKDRLPVAPATMTIELMKRAVQQLFPDKKIVAIENIQFLKWVDVAPSTNITIKMKKTEALRVAVQIEGYAQGTMVFAGSFPAPPPGDTKPFLEETPVPITPEQMYRERLMFHGPAYQGIIGFTTMGKDGIEGELEALPASGALLDVAGQLLGIWVVICSTQNHMAFPTFIRKIRFFGPDPATGSRFKCRVRVVKCEPTLAKADIHVFNRDGSLWAVCEGWTDNRLETDEKTWPVCTMPQLNLMVTPREEGYVWLYLPLRSYTLVWRMLMSYLRTTDREKVPVSSFYLTRSYLLGSIVIIDAVRDFLWKRGHGPMYPIEIRVLHDENGRSIVSGPFKNDLRVSFSEKEGTAVACVGEGEDVGIELERVEERAQGFVDAMFSPAEIAVLTKAKCLEESRRDEWITRAWCAKEAVNKMKGGKPQDPVRKWCIEKADGERFRIDGTWVISRREGDYIVALTEKQ